MVGGFRRPYPCGIICLLYSVYMQNGVVLGLRARIFPVMRSSWLRDWENLALERPLLRVNYFPSKDPSITKEKTNRNTSKTAKHLTCL